MKITGGARLAGIMGWPVAHSRSPLLHGFWLEETGVDGAYVPLAVRPEHIEPALRALPLLGFRGCNLTIPHKQTALSVVDKVEPLARRIGAVNTIVVAPDKSLEGRNTDAFGFRENLREAVPNWRPQAGPAVILGAGGSARAVVAALADAGVEVIRIVNRTHARAEALAGDLLTSMTEITIHSWDEVGEVQGDAGLLVNTTSLGMSGEPPLVLDLSPLPASAPVVDIVYVPLETGLLAEARRRGHPVVDGLGMLLHQGRPGFEAWFGAPAQVSRELRAAILDFGTLLIVLGLTGSIGMGKSTAAAMLQRLGVPLFDADRVVHRLLAPGGAAVAPVAAAFPGVRSGAGGIDRARLGREVFAHAEALARLERIIHPMVVAEENRFLARARARRESLAVLDVPLLFETGGERRCDYVIVVSAPGLVQRQRVLRRPGMTEGRLAASLRRQMADIEKRRRADFVVLTGLDRNRSLRQLLAIVRLLRSGKSRLAGRSRWSAHRRRRGR